jgi:hypothetical protein
MVSDLHGVGEAKAARHSRAFGSSPQETTGGCSIWLLLRISFGIFRRNFRGSGALKRWCIDRAPAAMSSALNFKTMRGNP